MDEIRTTLKQSGADRAALEREYGISRSTLYRIEREGKQGKDPET